MKIILNGLDRLFRLQKRKYERKIKYVIYLMKYNSPTLSLYIIYFQEIFKVGGISEFVLTDVVEALHAVLLIATIIIYIYIECG